jgi:hypothetical protein
MVGPFGGVTAAQALNAVLQHPQRLGEPVALTVNFCAALADGPFAVTARPGAHQPVHPALGDRDDSKATTVLTATAFTATRRDTWSAEEHALPAVPAPADVPLPTARGPGGVDQPL